MKQQGDCASVFVCVLLHIQIHLKTKQHQFFLTGLGIIPWYQFLNYAYFCILLFHWTFRLPNSVFFSPNLKFPRNSTKSLRRRGSYGSCSHWSWRRCTEGGCNWWSSPQGPTPLKNSDWIFYIISIKSYVSVQDWLGNRSVCVYLYAFHVFSVFYLLYGGHWRWGRIAPWWELLRLSRHRCQREKDEPSRLAQLGGRVATNRKHTQVCGRIVISVQSCNHNWR